MEDNRQFFECQECGAEGSAATDMDLVVEFLIEVVQLI